MGLDLLHIIEGNQETIKVDDAILSENYINAFKKARNKGFYIEHIMRRIRPFVEEKIRTRDCCACGSRIVVYPDGLYGQCEGFVHSRQFSSSKKLSMSEYIYEKDFLNWKNRLHFDYKKCRNCPAIAVCGGGCPYNSFMQYKTINNVDEKNCKTSVNIVNFLIKDIYENLNIEAIKSNIYIPSSQEKKIIYNKIKTNFNLPLVKNHSEIVEKYGNNI